MNVFILNTGRCGSTTFIKACRHITNFTSEHESRSDLIGCERLAYPSGHIEADNRLSWFLGRLDEAYGDGAMYVHLIRDKEKTARSFAARYADGIMGAYQRNIIMKRDANADPMDVCRDYYDTVNANIRLFLREKSRVMTFECEHPQRDFQRFWKWVGAEGDYTAALAEWSIPHNATKPKISKPKRWLRAATHVVGIRAGG